MNLTLRNVLPTGLAVLLAWAGYEAGRASIPSPPRREQHQHSAARQDTTVFAPLVSVADDPLQNTTVRNIAAVPFTQLYDVLRAATPERLRKWARELEQMPEGPRRTASVTTFYKSLVQVNPSAALAAVAQIKSKPIQEQAAHALLRTVPESLWGEIAEFFETIPFPGESWEDPIANWSRVDPVAVSHFIESHPKKLAEGEEEDDRVLTLLSEWAEMDPAGAKEWMDADPSRHTTSALTTWVMAFAEHDRLAAANFLLANNNQQNLADAIRHFSYWLFRDYRDDFTGFVFQLSAEQAHMAVQNVAERTAALILHPPEGYQREPSEVAPWLATLPTDFWTGAMGKVLGTWLLFDAPPAMRWVEQMTPQGRDIALADLCRAPQEHQFGGQPEKVVADIVRLGLKISDPNVRDESLRTALRHLGYDEEKRRAAIEELPVSAEEKRYLQRLAPLDEQE